MTSTEPTAPTTSWWISWYNPKPGDPSGYFTLHWPWWITGERTSDYAFTVCAAVRAEDEDAAKALIAAAFESPTAPDAIEWRFVQDMSGKPGWSPYSDRFPKADWMPEWAVPDVT